MSSNSVESVSDERHLADLRWGGLEGRCVSPPNPDAARRLHACLRGEATEYRSKPSSFMIRCGAPRHGRWYPSAQGIGYRSHSCEQVRFPSHGQHGRAIEEYDLPIEQFSHHQVGRADSQRRHLSQSRGRFFPIAIQGNPRNFVR